MAVQSPAPLRSTGMSFRQKLLELMEKKDWSVSDLATAAGLSYPTVRAYTAKGDNARLPTLANAFKLADALGVDVSVFRNCDDFAEPKE